MNVFLYRLSLTKARLQGMFPNPANDNNYRLVLGGLVGKPPPSPRNAGEEVAGHA